MDPKAWIYRFVLKKIDIGGLVAPLAEKDQLNNQNVLFGDFDSTALYHMMWNTFSNR